MYCLRKRVNKSRVLCSNLQQIAYEASKWHTDPDGRKGEALHAEMFDLLAVHKSVWSGSIIKVSSGNHMCRSLCKRKDDRRMNIVQKTLSTPGTPDVAPPMRPTCCPTPPVTEMTPVGAAGVALPCGIPTILRNMPYEQHNNNVTHIHNKRDRSTHTMITIESVPGECHSRQKFKKTIRWI